MSLMAVCRGNGSRSNCESNPPTREQHTNNVTKDSEQQQATAITQHQLSKVEIEDIATMRM